MAKKNNKLIWVVIGVIAVVFLYQGGFFEDLNLFSIVYGNNLVSNPGMEEANGSNPAYWFMSGANSNHLLIWDNQSHSGSKSLSMKVINSTKSWYRWYGNRIDVEPNTLYYVEYWYKTENLPAQDTAVTVYINGVSGAYSNAPARFVMEWREYNSTGNGPQKSLGIPWKEGNTSWINRTTYFKTGPNTTSLTPSFYFYTYSGQVWVDDFVIKKATDDYTPGSMNITDEYNWPGIKGVCVHPGHYTDKEGKGISTLKELGVTMAREDLSWSSVEKTKGVYDFKTYDNYTNILLNAGIEPLYIFAYGNCLYNSMPTSNVALPNIGVEEWKTTSLDWTGASTPTVADSWTVQFFNNAGGRISQSTDSHSGSYSLNVTSLNSSSSPYIAVFYLNSGIKLENQSTYNFSVWLKGNAKNVHIFVQEAGPTWGAISSGLTVNLTDTWKEYSFVFTTTNNVKVPTYRFTIDSIRSGQTILFDDVQITKNGIPLERKINQYECGRYVPRDPVEFEVFKEAYGEFCYQTVKHYKGKVKYFEIWNEPNGFWEPKLGDQYQADQYIELMKECYTRGKEANPEVIIMSAGIGTWDDLVEKYIHHYYINGAKDYFDIIAIHPYCDYSTGFPLAEQGKTCSTIENIKKIRDIMVEYNDSDKQIWITEFGYPTEGCYISSTTVLGVTTYKVTGCTTGLSEDNQNIRMINIFPTLREKYPYITAMFWYDFRDDCANNSRLPPGCLPNVITPTCPVYTECRFGLVRNDYSKKPAFYSYQSLAKSECTEDKCNGTILYECINGNLIYNGNSSLCGFDESVDNNITTNCTGSPTQECEIPNGKGIQTRICNLDGSWTEWDDCSISSCNQGYNKRGFNCVKKWSTELLLVVIGIGIFIIFFVAKRKRK